MYMNNNKREAMGEIADRWAKKRGITLVETTICLGLISIFSLVLYPILKTSNKVTKVVTNISIIEKDATRISNMIKRTLKNSGMIIVDYEGKEYVKTSACVLDEKRSLTSSIGKSTLSREVEEGNALFLEYPQSDGKKIKNSVIFFQFLSNSLYATEGEVKNGKIEVIEFEKLYEGNIEGSFKKLDNGIMITFEIVKKGSDEKLKVVEYENFNS